MSDGRDDDVADGDAVGPAEPDGRVESDNPDTEGGREPSTPVAESQDKLADRDNDRAAGLRPAVRRRTAHTASTPSEGETPRNSSQAGHGEPDRQYSSGRIRQQEQQEFDTRVSSAIAAIRQDDPRIDPALLRAYTTDRRSLNSSVQIQWGLWTTVSVMVLTLIITVVLSIINLPATAGAGVFVLLFALGMIWVSMRYRMWVYQVQDDSLYLERGVITHRRTHAPYVRIQHVDTRRSPLERWLGLSTLVVYTAGSRGADVSIPGLLPDEARDLQERVKQLAIEAEGGDAL